MKPYGFSLFGDTLVVRLVLERETPSGLININPSPMKQKQKPDAYVCTVEEVGPGCKLVKVGDRVVIERWEYSQHSIDDDLVWCKEVDVLILEGEKPAPGVVVMHTLDFKKENGIIDPEVITYRPNHHFGKIISSGWQCDKKLFGYVDKDCPDFCDHVKEGEYLWIERSSSYQYRLGEHTLIFKRQPGMIVMRGEEKKVAFDVVNPDNIPLLETAEGVVNG